MRSCGGRFLGMSLDGISESLQMQWCVPVRTSCSPIQPLDLLVVVGLSGLILPQMRKRTDPDK